MEVEPWLPRAIFVLPPDSPAATAKSPPRSSTCRSLVDERLPVPPVAVGNQNPFHFMQEGKEVKIW